MDKKGMKTLDTEKKDIKKVSDGKDFEVASIRNKSYFHQGDVRRRIRAEDSRYPTVNYRKPENEPKNNLEQCCSNLISPVDKDHIPVKALKNFLSISQHRNEKELERRRLIEENKIKNNSSQNDGNTKIRAQRKTDTRLDAPPKTLPKPPLEPQTKDSEKKIDHKDNHVRKPRIKTITKTDAKVYKSVAFVEQKADPTPIKIKIPHVHLKKEISKSSSSTSKSRNDSDHKEKCVETKRNTKPRRIKDGVSVSSPLFKMSQGPESPSTEVAKWVPSCVDSHTQPYYEAWISTTLAAVNKNQTNTHDVKYRNPSTASIESYDMYDNFVYDNMNEKYAGRIKIRQK